MQFVRQVPRAVRALVLAVAIFFAGVVPAEAKVTIVFWSQELGRNFPHAFFTLAGTPDAGGDPVDLTYGFTAKAITPAILMGNVPGAIDIAKKSYIARSDAHFSLELTDDQYHAVLSLVDEWGENGDHHYNMNKRNCVHFVAEAARRSGLTVVEDPKLMKKPRSFIQSVEAMNVTRVARIELPAKQYWATLTPAETPVVAAPAVTVAGTVPAAPVPPIAPAAPAAAQPLPAGVN